LFFNIPPLRADSIGGGSRRCVCAEGFGAEYLVC